MIEATTGTVLGYRLVLSNDGVSEQLTIWDDVAEKEVTFSVSFFTTIDNTKFACQNTKIPNDLFWAIALAVKQYELCENLPSNITIGKTKVVVVYWNAQFSPTKLFPIDRLPATDQIFTVPESMPTPAQRK